MVETSYSMKAHRLDVFGWKYSIKHYVISVEVIHQLLAGLILKILLYAAS